MKSLYSILQYEVLSLVNFNVAPHLEALLNYSPPLKMNPPAFIPRSSDFRRFPLFPHPPCVTTFCKVCEASLQEPAPFRRSPIHRVEAFPMLLFMQPQIPQALGCSLKNRVLSFLAFWRHVLIFLSLSALSLFTPFC